MATWTDPYGKLTGGPTSPYEGDWLRYAFGPEHEWFDYAWGPNDLNVDLSVLTEDDDDDTSTSDTIATVGTIAGVAGKALPGIDKAIQLGSKLLFPAETAASMGAAGLPTTLLGENVAPLGGGEYANVIPSMDIAGGLPAHLQDLLSTNPELLSSSLDYLGLGADSGSAILKGGMGDDILSAVSEFFGGGAAAAGSAAAAQAAAAQYGISAGQAATLSNAGLLAGGISSFGAVMPIAGLALMGFLNAVFGFGDSPEGGSSTSFQIDPSGKLSEEGRESWGYMKNRRPILDAFADPFYANAGTQDLPDWYNTAARWGLANEDLKDATLFNLGVEGPGGIAPAYQTSVWEGKTPSGAIGGMQGFLGEEGTQKHALSSPMSSLNVTGTNEFLMGAPTGTAEFNSWRTTHNQDPTPLRGEWAGEFTRQQLEEGLENVYTPQFYNQGGDPFVELMMQELHEAESGRP